MFHNSLFFIERIFNGYLNLFLVNIHNNIVTFLGRIIETSSYGYEIGTILPTKLTCAGKPT